MSQTVLFNGTNYTIPDIGENNWGQNVTDYLVAIAGGALQKTGGTFLLSAELDFGSNYGLKSLYYKSRSANVASTGIVRLANSDALSWRDAGNTTDLALAVNGSNQLTFNGIILESDTLPSGQMFVGDSGNSSTARAITGAWSMSNLGVATINNDYITNAMISPTAAIVYSKLSIAAGDIAYSKLTLTTSIVNGDISNSAAIAYSKLAALTASRMLVSDGSGVVAVSTWGWTGGNMTTVSNGALRFTDGTTNYVGLVAPAAVTTHTYALPVAAGTAGQVLSWQAGGQLQWINAAGGGTINSGTQYQLAYYGANGTTLSGLTLITASRALASDANGLPVASTTTDTELGYLSGVTGAIQTQIGNKLNLSGGTMTGAILFPDGTVSAPSMAFSSETGLGIYRAASGHLAMTYNGAVTLQIRGVNQDIRSSYDFVAGSHSNLGNATDYWGILFVGLGSAANPSITTGTDPNSGFYFGGGDDVYLSLGGTGRYTFLAGQMRFPDGSISAPSISFTSDVNSGVYWNSADKFSIVCGGNDRMTFETGAGLGISCWALFRATDGSTTYPAISFIDDVNSGFLSYNGTLTDAVRAISNGVEVFEWRNYSPGFTHLKLLTGQFLVPNGSVTYPAIGFDSDNDGTGTGFYRVGTNNIGITTNGVQAAYISDSSFVTNLPFYIPNGTAATPGLGFSSDGNTGIYSSASDRIAFSCGGTLKAQIRTEGLEMGASTQVWAADGLVSAPAYSFASDTNSGLFNEGGDFIKIVTGGALRISVRNGDVRFAVDAVSAGAAAANLGTATDYWNDVSYKTLTDRGCLPFCDDGVELSDGTIVSDLEAIVRLEKHPTKKTIHGLPMLDYKKFPKKAYRPADSKGVLLPRDGNDEPIGGADGIEMTMMFGVMLGAFKELKAQIEELKKGK